MERMMEKAVFGAGCFWGVQLAFDRMPGVISSSVGYSGGKRERPTYEQVCSDATGHAEVIEINFDPSQVSYQQLLEQFFDLHDPTQLNRQGPDIGSQYRSVVFFTTPEQREIAEQVKAAIAVRYKVPVVTAIESAQTFWPAEDYHQKYLEKRGRSACHI